MEQQKLYLPPSVVQDMLAKARSEGSEGDTTKEALENVLREYGVGTADLELARDDIGWVKLGVGTTGELPTQTRTEAIKRSRAFYNRDPLSKQAIRLWTDYALGRGINWHGDDERSDALLRAKFWAVPANKPILSNQGQRKSSDKLLTDGEVFFVFFTSMAGVCKIRLIDPLEITDIITDPNDQDTKLLYKRVWTNTQGQQLTAYYPDWLNPAPHLGVTDRMGAERTANMTPVVYHVPFGTIGLRGIPLLIGAMDWSKAHRKFLEARSSITQAMARFAWKAKIEGSAAQVTAIQDQLQSSLVGGGSAESNPPATPGSTWVENQGLTMTPIKAESGAAAAQVDANMLLQIFGTAVGVFPHYFGAGESFRLATATAMERPMRVQFEAYQQLWADVYANIFAYVFNKNNVAPDKQFVDIDFPPIIEKDAVEAVKTIVEVLERVPDLDIKELKALILTNLGINNVDQVLGDMPEMESSSAKLVKELANFRRQLLKEGHSNGNGAKEEGEVHSLS